MTVTLPRRASTVTPSPTTIAAESIPPSSAKPSCALVASRRALERNPSISTSDDDCSRSLSHGAPASRPSGGDGPVQARRAGRAHANPSPEHARDRSRVLHRRRRSGSRRRCRRSGEDERCDEQEAAQVELDRRVREMSRRASRTRSSASPGSPRPAAARAPSNLP